MIPSMVSDPQKVISTFDLLYVNNLGLNRGLSQDGVRKIDPDGIHVLSPVMLHNDSEMRCTAHIKASGTMNPIKIFFDVPLGVWGKLEGVDRYAGPEEDGRGTEE